MEPNRMRAKPPERVRTDAITMAKKRLDEGCTECARGYVELASRNGANRRHFIKAGLWSCAAAVLATSALAKPTPAKPASEAAVVDFWCIAQDGFCLDHIWYIVQLCCQGDAITGWACWYQLDFNCGSC